jgi:glucose-1-phosphate thymidylyltransferase
MWGIVPAAGIGSRMQPLAFSKELLPIGRSQEGEAERPRAVGEYLLERMVRAGARRICLVVSPAKPDIMEYFRGAFGPAHLSYVVQSSARGLCDAIFQALPLIDPAEEVLIGLPDTIWFPAEGLAELPDGRLSLLCFPVERPDLFDAVVADATGRVSEVQVKEADAASPWVWGAIKMTGVHLQELYALWRQRESVDSYLGTLLNAYIRLGREVWAERRGELYLDVGTQRGYREALLRLEARGLLGASPRLTSDRLAPPPRV